MSRSSSATGRIAQIGAKLGSRAVTVTRFQATEGLSQLSLFQIEFLSTDRLAVSDLIHESAVINVQSQASNSDPLRTRYFHGVVRGFSYLGEVDSPERADGRLSWYRAEVVPWLWFLTQRTNCRIFQNKTVTEIIETIFSEYTKFQYAFSKRLQGSYERYEYRVQYRESDFAFIARLMEEHGMFYYFRHTADKYELVLADHVGAYFDSDEPKVRFGASGTESAGDHVQTWEHDYEFRSGSVVHRDFNFEDTGSTTLMSQEHSGLSIPGAADVSLFDFPGGYRTKQVGDFFARMRMQEQETSHEVVRGTGVSPCFAPAAKFCLNSHPNAAEAKVDMLIVSVTHEVSGQVGSLRAGAVTTYQNGFTCIPAVRTFRPARITPRPFIQGAQTAIVTGPSEELVYPDRFGRVKVQFHWDREGQKDENSSCWIRVSQAWAGNAYGSVMLPHVGQEVIVSFLEGDPDRPIITGRVYNADNMPPETLPDKKHRAIVAQDEVGNIIVLDADEERVDIQNAKDKFELTVGESVSATAGMDLEITLGCGVGFGLGAAASAGLAAAFDVGVGITSSVFLGGAYDASFGGSFSYAKGNFVNAGDSVGQIAFKAGAEFVSHDSVMLAGGTGANNSVVMCDSDNLVISYGMTAPNFKGNPSLALGLGVFGVAVLGTVGIAATAAAAFLGAKAAEKEEFDEYAGGAVASGVGGLALSAVAAGLLTVYAKKWSQMKQPVHGGALPAKAQLILEANGIAAVGEKEISVMAGMGGQQGLVKLIADEVQLSSMTSTVMGDLDVKGKLTSANILDIGAPAAAAAAKAAAIAIRAGRLAAIAATGASNSAKKASEAAAAMQ